MLKILSKTVSYLLHPALMPIIGIFIIFTSTHLMLLPIQGKIAILKVVAVCTILLPLSVLPLMYYHKRISNIEVSARNERLLPVFISVVFYFTAYYALSKMGAPRIINQFILSAFVSLALAGIIHFKWKISLHMIGMGGLIALVSAISFLYKTPIQFYLVSLILLTGVSGSARLYLEEHTQEQIYSGFLVGFVTTFSIIVLMNI